MKNFSEKTLIKCVVNLKVNGFLGRHIRCFNKKERNAIIDELIRRGWLDEKMNLTQKSQEIVLKNLELAD